VKFSELLRKIKVSEDEVLDALESDEKRKKFFNNHSEQIGSDYELDVYAMHMILEMWNK